MYRTRMNSYYPEVIKCIEEFKAIIDSEYPEFDLLTESRDKIPEDAYLLTMGEDRVAEWEKVFGIKPIEGSSVSDRRDTIIARIRGQGKLNTALINSIVNAFTGGTANSWVEDSTLYVEITPPPENKQYKFANVEQEIKLKVPAHLNYKVSRNYYEWGELKNHYEDWYDVKSEFDNWGEVLLFSPFSLPYKTRVKYIRSTGKQYIDTLFNPKYNSSVVMNVGEVRTNTGCFFGATDSYTGLVGTTFAVSMSGDYEVTGCYFGSVEESTVSSLETAVRNGIRQYSNETAVNDVKITHPVKTEGEVPNSLYLFAMHTIGNPAFGTNAFDMITCDLYGCRIYDDTELIRDFIPVLDWDDVPCLYDKVSNTCFYNLGTEPFGYGY